MRQPCSVPLTFCVGAAASRPGIARPLTRSASGQRPVFDLAKQCLEYLFVCCICVSPHVANLQLGGTHICARTSSPYRYLSALTEVNAYDARMESLLLS
jgi:hypothetical protein